MLETLSTTRAEISLALEKERAIVSYFSVGIGTKKLKETETEAKNATAESLKQKKKDEFQLSTSTAAKEGRQGSLCVWLSLSLSLSKELRRWLWREGLGGFIKGSRIAETGKWVSVVPLIGRHVGGDGSVSF